jgi:hypothetical protein
VSNCARRSRNAAVLSGIAVSIIFGEHHGRSSSQIDNPSYKSD